ncbi:hypothetical protein MCUN1_001323 [Malassezia cuniculi]|uniref:Uncharacterized protein n=1 Tax=Malassezia cuniculi TaxID=948313 RepID=A0AAF0J5G5_9BASI|nr:hypothetical protein MCUN1_001323 [Malassezia cuniculi]
MSEKPGTASASHTRSAPVVDYVLKFQGVPPRCASGRGKVSPSESAATADEFRRLITTLRSLGLQVTSRVGKSGSGTITVFVCAPNSLLEELHVRERVSGYLSGVYTGECRLPADAAQARGAIATPHGTIISPADRVRYVHQLLTAPKPRSRRGTGRLLSIHGAELSVRSADYPHLIDMMPLHDRAFDKRWISAWSRVSFTNVLFGIHDEDLDELRFYWGGNTAMYFAFLNTYFTSLLPVAVLGLFFWAGGYAFDAMYAALLVIWCCAFTEGWRVREKKLAVRWGQAGVSNVDARNASFTPRDVKTDPVTGEEVEIFEWWRRQLRVLLSLPFVALFAMLLVGVFSFIFAFEIVAGEVYDGPGKSIVPFIPTVLFSTCIPIVLSVWQACANVLTNFENHASERSHQASLMLKIFGMRSLVTYGGLVLTAFVYIPFGEGIIRYIYEQGWVTWFARIVSRNASLTVAMRHDFQVRPDRLREQLFALCVTGQVTNTVVETLVPIIIRTAMRWKSALGKSSGRVKQEKEPQRVSFAADALEREFLGQVESEFGLATYDTFVDYAEMASQFGNIALWSVIWPLAPVMGFINNWFELRSDAFKLCVNMRRPVPMRAETIGPWNKVLAVLVRLAAFTNAALVYLFEERTTIEAGRRVSVTVMRTYLFPTVSVCEKIGLGGAVGGIIPSFLPRSGAAGALAASFLFALLCEQVFSMLRALIAYMFHHLSWEDSEEYTALRRQQWESRVSVVDQLERARASDNIMPSPQRERLHKDQSFWDAAHDDGLAYITRHGKAE